MLRFALSKPDESNCFIKGEKKRALQIQKTHPRLKQISATFLKKNPDKFQSINNFVELLP